MAGMNNYTTLIRGTNENLHSDEDELLQPHVRRNIYQRAAQTYQNTRIEGLDDDCQKSYLESINLNQGTPNSMKPGTATDHESSPLLLDKQRLVEKLYDSHDETEEISMKRLVSFGVQWISLVAENLLSHPFVVLRRQCQVYHASAKYHLHPVYLIPTLVHLHRRQGVTTLWKGVGSCLLVRGTSMAMDDILSKLTNWPKDVSSSISLKRFGEHILLKSISIALVMPFYAASLVETVQSDIASEKPGLFDVFREGSLRLLYWSSPQKGRMLPIWALMPATVTVGVAKYIVSLFIKGISGRVIRRRLELSEKAKGAKHKRESVFDAHIEIYSHLSSLIITEILFYPLETILHRLQLQGTRTIIDNLDNGYTVVPILTNYQGFIDCFRSTVSVEGFAGLYKGFGAMLLQFAAHLAVIKLTKWVVARVNAMSTNRPSSKVIEYYNLDRELISNSTSISHSLSGNQSGSCESLGPPIQSNRMLNI